MKTSAKSQLLKKLLNNTTKPLGKATSHQGIDAVQNSYKITRVTDQQYYPVSFAQKRMFLLHQMDPSSVSYNLPLAMNIEGEIDFERFQSAVNQLVDRHECLRTGIRMIEDNVVQFIKQDVQIPIEKFCIKEDELQELMKRFSRPFDISQAPLARIAIVELEPERHLLLIDVHHIIADGISLQVILRDLMLLYSGGELQPLQLRYRDYAIWQEKWFESEGLNKQEEYWLKQFETDAPVLDLPTDFSRQDFLVAVGSDIEFSFSRTETELIKRLARDLAVTDYTLVLGMFSVLLAKYSGQDDIVVGSPIAGRRQPEVQEVVGMFVNTIAIRSAPISSKKFSNYIKDLRETVLMAIDAQDYPFEALVEKTGVTRNINRNPLFDVMFSMLNMKKTNSVFNNLEISSYPYKREVANFDLELYMIEENNKMQFRLEYNSSLFREETVKQMIRHFQYITKQVLDNPYQDISEIHLLNRKEKTEAIERHCGVESSEDNLVFTQVFEEQVRKNPDATAVVCDERILTYSQLNSWSNRVANTLLALGTNDEELITLWLDRDLEFLTSMLGVFKAAAAYVPVDPALPEERIRTILEESNSQWILTERKYEAIVRNLAGQNVKVLLIEELLTNDKSMENPQKSILPANLAYVIFTSGSTGKPKGAMVEHRGMLNHIRAKVLDLKLNKLDKVAETATQSFDVSVWQFLTALTVGGTTVIFKGTSAWQPKPLLDRICKHGVTVFETVPSHLMILLDEIEENYKTNNKIPLKWMMLNGEPLLSELCRRWFECYPDIPIINAYGPTECSDDVTHYIVGNISDLVHPSVPISGTVMGMRIYVLDENLNQVAKGVIGELYIGGIGVGRGYLEDPIKTASAFLPDIFAKKSGERMYKTGDLVRELINGTIEIIGRSDYQVKVNGMRIELSEIEHALLATEMVREAVVIAGEWDKGNGKQLCAYVALKPNIKLSELKSVIKSILPSHMLPTFWVTLKNLPLLINGKVNRKALPDPDLEESMQRECIVPPQADDQRFIAKLWSEVLNLEESKISLHHDFFQLGGNSLKAMRVVSKIRTQMGIDLPFTRIFSAPILEDFVELLRQDREVVNCDIQHFESEVISDLQTISEHQRIYRQNMQMNNSVVFNMPYQSVIEGELDVIRAEKAFRAVCDRHWMMKAKFSHNELGDLILQNHSPTLLEFTTDISNEEDIPEHWSQFVKPFDIENGPLFRMKVFTVNSRRHYLFFDNHTLSADFASKRLILRDFVSYYLGRQLEPLSITYPDYIYQRLSRSLRSDAIKQRDLWEKEFAKNANRLVSQDAKNLTELGMETAQRLVIEIDEKLLSKVTAFAKVNSVSEHSVFMSVFSLALSNQFKQDQFFVLSPVTDRDIPEFEEIVGLLFDTVPVPQRIRTDGTFGEHLVQTHQNVMKAYSMRADSAIRMYDELAELDSGVSGGFFDTTFVWVEAPSVDFKEIGFSVKEIVNEKVMARFDIRLEAFRGESNLKLILEYRERLFTPSTIESLMRKITEGLKFMVNNTDEKISIWREENE
ncbi:MULTISPECIES: non-ribosomal peptide synthetase [Bacillus cereus group]|uniref:non-ribosomal peptide synthetase n=1 Tax=Bacillus cereus group TaxID=86661 RepID=UPI000BF4D33A|nr:non-ribosomal peptide synthetase [Bacillus thuringiensis]PEV26180.1 hypothetical protein CN420_15230 [Bacillus thuringiensis]PFS70466.1 hypothetical protein COK50_22450 [Bacillus thuringiensis]WLP62666.1 non-ribosomal peptide synthetase [Bacillus thuringiensis]